MSPPPSGGCCSFGSIAKGTGARRPGALGLVPWESSRPRGNSTKGEHHEREQRSLTSEQISLEREQKSERSQEGTEKCREGTEPKSTRRRSRPGALDLFPWGSSHPPRMPSPSHLSLTHHATPPCPHRPACTASYPSSDHLHTSRSPLW